MVRDTSLPGQPIADGDEREPAVAAVTGSESAREAVGGDDVVCELCLQPGHRKQDCEFYMAGAPGAQAQQQRRSRLVPNKSSHRCYQCGQLGHWKLECPQNPDRGGPEPLQDPPAQEGGSRSDLRSARADANRFNKPLPSDVDITIPGIANAWEWFQRVDVNGNGSLSLDEVMELSSQLGLKWSKGKMARAYEDMTTDDGLYTATAAADCPSDEFPSNGRGASFRQFSRW